jgi:hypothetical protein
VLPVEHHHWDFSRWDGFEPPPSPSFVGEHQVVFHQPAARDLPNGREPGKAPAAHLTPCNLMFTTPQNYHLES